MKRTILLIGILILTACTQKPAIATDAIAGYWSGTVDGKRNASQEVQTRDIGIMIIAECSTGKVCGKFDEDNTCPSDIVLTNVEENQYKFVVETVSGTRHACGVGDITIINLELLPNGTIHFVIHNGEKLSGFLHKQ
jgi:hypothetical protein